MADNLDDDEYRIPLPVERAGLADGATKAASLLPIDVMDSIAAATTIDDDDVDEEVIIDLERLLLLFV